MAEFAKEILPVDIEEEMKQSYLDYAMSVIVSRALPDARDGAAFFASLHVGRWPG